MAKKRTTAPAKHPKLRIVRPGPDMHFEGRESRPRRNEVMKWKVAFWIAAVGFILIASLSLAR